MERNNKYILNGNPQKVVIGDKNAHLEVKRGSQVAYALSQDKPNTAIFFNLDSPVTLPQGVAVWSWTEDGGIAELDVAEYDVVNSGGGSAPLIDPFGDKTTMVVSPDNLSEDFVLDKGAKKIQIGETLARTSDVDTKIKNAENRANHTGEQPFSTISGVADVSQLPKLPAEIINDGVFNITQLPVGIDEKSVSKGNHVHSDVTPTVSGFMTPQDKVKLDGLIQVNKIDLPTIEIPDPPDVQSLQVAFDAILKALKDMGVSKT